MEKLKRLTQEEYNAGHRPHIPQGISTGSRAEYRRAQLPLSMLRPNRSAEEIQALDPSDPMLEFIAQCISGGDWPTRNTQHKAGLLNKLYDLYGGNLVEMEPEAEPEA